MRLVDRIAKDIDFLTKSRVQEIENELYRLRDIGELLPIQDWQEQINEAEEYVTNYLRTMKDD